MFHSTIRSKALTARRQAGYVMRHLANRVEKAHIQDVVVNLANLPETPWHVKFRSEPIYAPLSATIIADLPKIQAQPQAYFVKAPRRFQTDLPAWSCEYFSLRVHKPSSLKSANLKKPLSFPQPRTPSAEHLTPPRTLERRMIRSGLLPPETVTEVTASLPQKSKTYEMALTIFTSKKDVHRLASVRHVAAQRVRHTVRLLLQYGLRYDSGKKAYVTGPAGPHEWLLQGHSYIVRINLECFRMPQEKLLADMATGLRAVKELGLQMATEAEVLRQLSASELEAATEQASEPV